MGSSRSIKMRALAKFVRLPAPDRRLLVRALLTLAMVRASIALTQLLRLHRALDRFTSRFASRPGTQLDGGIPEPAKIAWAVTAASRILRGECLPRACAAYRMLRHYGYPAELKLGAGRGMDGGFVAHAWVESEGRIVIGDFEHGRYIELNRTAPGHVGPLAGPL